MKTKKVLAIPRTPKYNGELTSRLAHAHSNIVLALSTVKKQKM
jgi:hypothetical protein